jgi:hypothetical protein
MTLYLIIVYVMKFAITMRVILIISYVPTQDSALLDSFMMVINARTVNDLVWLALGLKIALLAAFK